VSLSDPPSRAAAARSTTVLVVLALAPLWLVGMFDRGLWTPDEPREADIAWRMSQQSDRSLPQLAGTPFLEKPPLSYWMSGAAIALCGDSAPAARIPNLLYALIAAVSISAIALGMLGEVAAAACAAIVSLSALLAFRVSVWLAPDAALLGGSALALLGAWSGYRATPGVRKAAGYTLMHVGAAAGFMAKSAPGWLVPALTLLTLITWERRWSELRRWELYAGFALQALLIGPWLLTVAHGVDGAQALRALFWNNVIGRFTRVSAPSTLEYTTGHHNWPGKYLLELPVYLLPWTLLVVAALVRAPAALRGGGVPATAWRFALAACLPFIVLLSFAATARDVYAAPALLGLGLLAGLWLQSAQRAAGALDRLLLTSSRYLVLLLAWLFAVALVLLARSSLISWPASCCAAALIVAAAHLAVRFAARAQQRQALSLAALWMYAGYGCTVLVTLWLVSPVIDAWQDLPRLAREINSDTRQRPLALLDPDETTIAVLDHGLRTPFSVLSSAAGADVAVRAWFDSRGPAARVLVLLPGHAPQPFTRRQELPETGAAATLVTDGTAVLAHIYALPQGRHYALLAPAR
jgi:4-amino-4-deoxy-L-arabinose transferase-like glycosyltransferase